MELNPNGEQPRPRLGVGILIQNSQGQVLLGLRKNSHGSGEWSFPGGHVEFGETLFEAAEREVQEETGLDVDQLELISVADDFRYLQSDGRHYLTIGIRAQHKSGQPEVLEADKCERWQWFDLDKLPAPLFGGTQLTLRNFTDKKIYQPGR